MKIQFGKFVLADHGDADAATGKPSGPGGLVINGTRVVQVDEFTRGEFIEVKDRGNRAKTITFSAQRQFKSYGEAEAFCLTHDIALPVKDELVLLCPKNGGGAIKLTATEAAVASVSCSHRGVSVTVSYQIICGELT